MYAFRRVIWRRPMGSFMPFRQHDNLNAVTDTTFDVAFSILRHVPAMEPSTPVFTLHWTVYLGSVWRIYTSKLLETGSNTFTLGDWALKGFTFLLKVLHQLPHLREAIAPSTSVLALQNYDKTMPPPTTIFRKLHKPSVIVLSSLHNVL